MFKKFGLLNSTPYFDSINKFTGRRTNLKSSDDPYFDSYNKFTERRTNLKSSDEQGEQGFILPKTF